MTHIQEFLINGGTLDQLMNSPYKLMVKRHQKHPNLVLFKYHKSRSTFDNPILCEARGLILNESDNWKIVCYPYNKFFNFDEKLGEEVMKKLTNTPVSIYEKVDGSLMTLYYYHDEWHVSTTGRPDASGTCGRQSFTFADLFWKVWNSKNYKLPTDTTKCYMFELTTPDNKVIVPYKDERIVLHGVRNLITLQEELPIGYDWEQIAIYEYENLDKAIENARKMVYTDGEGYVFCNSTFDRVKVKSEDYLKQTYQGVSINNISSKTILQIVRLGEQSEYLTIFPSQEERINKATENYRKLVESIEDKITNIDQYTEDQLKSFWYYNCIKAKCNGKINTVEHWLKSINVKKLSQYVQVPRERRQRSRKQSSK